MKKFKYGNHHNHGKSNTRLHRIWRNIMSELGFIVIIGL